MRRSISNISENRDLEAESISDMSIHRSVVSKIVEMDDIEIKEKIDLLFQVCPTNVIFSQLSLCKSNGLLDNTSYNDYMEKCLLELKNHSPYHSFKYFKKGD